MADAKARRRERLERQRQALAEQEAGAAAAERKKREKRIKAKRDLAVEARQIDRLDRDERRLTLGILADDAGLYGIDTMLLRRAFRVIGILDKCPGGLGPVLEDLEAQARLDDTYALDGDPVHGRQGSMTSTYKE